MLPNYHLLIIQGVPATKAKPARIKIISVLYKEAVTISYTDEVKDTSTLLPMAIHWLRKNGFEVNGTADGIRGNKFVISSTFKSITNK